jgi:AcrR family transcriptional regulator
MRKAKPTTVKKRSVPKRVPAKKPARKAAPLRKNMRAAEREKVILDSAIRFFAEHGFEGQTRELAKRIGITHSAIYRHFPSKEALIERVYEEVYLGGWQKHWAALIVDRSLSLEARLTQFYCEYADRIFSFEWVRIFVYSGLKSFDINQRYLTMVMSTIGEPALLEMRHELGVALPANAPIAAREHELFWGLHGRIFYIAVRKFVYGTPVPEGAERHGVIADGVKQFMMGARQMADESVRSERVLSCLPSPGGGE